MSFKDLKPNVVDVAAWQPYNRPLVEHRFSRQHQCPCFWQERASPCFPFPEKSVYIVQLGFLGSRKQSCLWETLYTTSPPVQTDEGQESTWRHLIPRRATVWLLPAQISTLGLAKLIAILSSCVGALPRESSP